MITVTSKSNVVKNVINSATLWMRIPRIADVRQYYRLGNQSLEAAHGSFPEYLVAQV
jgi:hypothetical protein